MKVLVVVTAAWKFIIGKKFRISQSFLRVTVRDEIGSKFLKNFDFFPFVENSGRPVISNLKTSAQKGRNNAAAFKLLK